MTEAGVEFAQVSYAPASSRLLLQDVSLRLEPGTVTALLGRSGSGKTTLLRMVNGLVMPSAGQVTVGGKPTTEWDKVALRRGIGYCIQETGLFPHRTVEWNVGLALDLAGRPAGEIAARVAEVMALCGLDARPVAGLATRYPWQLSGGQRQRAGLARAMANRPGVLLMDEPFGALDPLTRAEMQTMLKTLLQQVRTTVLLVTHDLDEALFLADRVVFLAEGRLAADLEASAVLGAEHEVVREYVAAVRRVPA
jgi:osmoprotectant transport system ATP-binding protein